MRTADGGRRTADGGRRTADGGRRTADGGRRTADGGRRTADYNVIGKCCIPISSKYFEVLLLLFASRVGDSPIAGAGSYADNDVGAAAATGNGDVMTRFLPTYQAVEFMRQGYTPAQASQMALARIGKRYKDFVGSIIAVNKKGEYGMHKKSHTA
ncbi:hypothetical protein QZH41_012516, partial [Actinostola sp. cb2023]